MAVVRERQRQGLMWLWRNWSLECKLKQLLQKTVVVVSFKCPTLIVWASISALLHLYKRNENMSVHPKTCEWIFTATFCIIEKLETVQVPIKWIMDKQNLPYPCEGIIFSNKREQNTDTFYNTSEPEKHFAKWKNPGKKPRYWVIDSYETPTKERWSLLTAPGKECLPRVNSFGLASITGSLNGFQPSTTALHYQSSSSFVILVFLSFPTRKAP